MNTGRHSDLIRSSALTGYESLVTGLGGTPGTLLRRVGIDAAALGQTDATISFRAVIRLLELSAAALRCPDFGLRLAGRQDLRILGPVAVIGLNCPTVGDALKAMIEHLGFYSPLILTTIVRSSANQVLLTYDIALDEEPRRRQIVELAMGLYQRHMQTLIGTLYHPSAVWLRHVSTLPQSIYRAHFGIRAKLGQSLNALVVRPEDLDTPLNNIDPHLRRVIEDYVKQNISNHPLEIQRQVAYFVRRLLPAGSCTLPGVAQRLHVHYRTLQRRLAEASLTFEQIVDRVRRERAQELLSQSNLSMAQIAEQLGYVEQSSFNRACWRWFSGAPGQFKTGSRHIEKHAPRSHGRLPTATVSRNAKIMSRKDK